MFLALRDLCCSVLDDDAQPYAESQTYSAPEVMKLDDSYILPDVAPLHPPYEELRCGAQAGWPTEQVVRE